MSRGVLCALFGIALGFGLPTVGHAEQIVGIGGKCLDVARGNRNNGATVEIWTCGASYPNQRWTVIGDAIVGIGGKCLDVAGGGTRNGTRVVMWTCRSGANQRFRFRDGELVGIGNKCVDVEGGDTSDGTAVVLWDCHGGPNQKWSRMPSIISPGGR